MIYYQKQDTTIYLKTQVKSKKLQYFRILHYTGESSKFILLEDPKVQRIVHNWKANEESRLPIK